MNTLAQFVYPGQPVQKSLTRREQVCDPVFPVRKKYPKTKKNATSGRAAAPPRRVS